ncbi:MAG: hypothetical protein LAN64_16600 [Acidobacteriia bacterium]|nr:hypothetical protein [Terriglobia bacterium]
MTPQEPDFEPGHPARFDYDPSSPQAKEWARTHFALKGERDFPVGHPKAFDTPGNTNAVPVLAGIDPAHPELQEFSGRTPAQVEGLKLYQQFAAPLAQESPVLEPTEAPQPPPPIERPIPPGQPGS